MENYLKHRIIDTIKLKNGKTINVYNDVNNNDKINGLNVIGTFSADNITELKKHFFELNSNDTDYYCFKIDKLYSKGLLYIVRILQK